MPPPLELCDDDGVTGGFDGMSEEPPPPMLVRDAIPPDVAEQPPKAAQNNNKRTARHIVNPHTYAYNAELGLQLA